MLSFLNQFQPRHLREFARHIRNFRYEPTEDGGILLADAKLVFSGIHSVSQNGGPWTPHKNLLPVEGINHLLDVGIHGVSATATWYTAPFSGNVTPLSTHTAATFASAFTELTTQYSESTRIAFVEGAAAAGVINNHSSPAVMTTAVDTVTVYGSGVLSVSTKGATTGVLLSVAKYASSYSLPTTGGTLGIKHQITAASS